MDDYYDGYDYYDRDTDSDGKKCPGSGYSLKYDCKSKKYYWDYDPDNDVEQMRHLTNDDENYLIDDEEINDYQFEHQYDN